MEMLFQQECEGGEHRGLMLQVFCGKRQQFKTDKGNIEQKMVVETISKRIKCTIPLDPTQSLLNLPWTVRTSPG